MNTLTLGIVVIIYMFVLAWLGYIGYKQTKNASDYLLGGRKSILSSWPYHMGQLSYPHRPSSVSEGWRQHLAWESNGFVC